MTNNNCFISWFIGFSEGDGSWFIRKNNTVGFEVSQHSCDAALLYEIKSQLGFGTVNHNSKLKISRFCITKSDIPKIINIFNSNIISNYRFYQFSAWCNYIHQNITTVINIDKLSKNNKVISLNDAWLSGFIDAEGCFRIAIDKDRPKMIFEISQKESDLLRDIANLLSLKKNIRKDRNTFVLYTSDYNAKEILIKYIDQYALKTKKNISYINWRKAHYLDRKDPQYMEKILKLKEKISNNVKNLS